MNLNELEDLKEYYLKNLYKATSDNDIEFYEMRIEELEEEITNYQK